MNIAEAKKADCPRDVLCKLERAGVSEFTKSGTNWNTIGRDADMLYYKKHPEKMFFGKKLKELRLKYAEKGLRSFSMEMGMGGSEYHALERGYAPPPKDKEWIHKLLKKLQIVPYSEDEMDLYIEWNKPFVMQLMDEDIFISHALMTDGTSADTKKLVEVSEYMQNIAIEHNKKAREYNGSK